MRGKARLTREARRLYHRLRRPDPPQTPQEVLATGLEEAYRPGGRPDPGALVEAFRFVHPPADVAACARRPEANLGLVRLAEETLSGQLPFFERSLPVAEHPDWFRVPEGGKTVLGLPQDLYDGYDHIGSGDLRLLAELGRLQELPLLCAAGRITGRGDFERLAMARLADFRGRNPVDWGPHWFAHLEAALRIFSMLWAWGLAGDLRDEDHLLLAAALLEHGRSVDAHLAIKPVANNHLIGEVAALFALGCALPVFPESQHWRDRAWRILDEELAAQVYADGVDGEQAVEYHRFVLEFYLQALLWGRAAADERVEVWGDRLRDMLAPLAALTGPDGQLVSLGDDDTGRILRLDERSRRDARGLLAAAGHLLGADRPGPFAGELAGEPQWLLGTAAPAARGPAGELPLAADFPVAGWYAARFGSPAGEAGLPGGHLVFRAGDMGRGGAGHSHADLLSLDLSVSGQPLLLDPGVYLYNGPQRWRDHFRSGRAHSLLRVAGRDGAELLPPPDRFGWARKGEARLLAGEAGTRFRYWHGRREGDRDAEGRPLACHRRLLLLPPALLLILDHLSPLEASAAASGFEVDLELQWQCAPGLAVETSPPHPVALAPDRARRQIQEAPPRAWAHHSLTLGGEARALLAIDSLAPAGLAPFHRLGETAPPGGWYSPDYGVKVPAPSAGLTGRVQAPVLLLSILDLAPDPDQKRLQPPWQGVGEPGKWIGAARQQPDGGTLNVLAALPGQPEPPELLLLGGLELRAEAVLARSDAQGEFVYLFVLGGREIRLAGRSLQEKGRERGPDSCFEYFGGGA